MPRRVAPAPAEAGKLETMARDVIYRQLAMRARSRAQLAKKLADRGIPEDIASRTLAKFEAAGLVDDAAYADAVVRGRRHRLSRRALAHELRADGVAGAVAEAALAEVTRDDERETAQALADAKARKTVGLERTVRERRIAGMLARRGYSADIVLAATRQALQEATP